MSGGQPMAFTCHEFVSGIVATWLAFLGLLALGLTLMAVVAGDLTWAPLYLMFGVPIGAVVAAIVALIASPAVWWVARRLADVPQRGVHLAVYAVLGAALGTAVIEISVIAFSGDFATTFASPHAAYVIASCSVALMAGWAWGSRRTPLVAPE